MKLPRKKKKIENWPDMKLFFNKARREIVHTCSTGTFSIQDLSRKMGLNPGSIHNHVTKLLNAGYLTIAETREVNGIIEKKYIKSAEYIEFGELNAQDNKTRNNYISHLMQKESLRMLDDGDVFSVRINYAKLDEESYKEACHRIKDLIGFLQEKNNSGDKNVQMLSCLGLIQ